MPRKNRDGVEIKNLRQKKKIKVPGNFCVHASLHEERKKELHDLSKVYQSSSSTTAITNY